MSDKNMGSKYLINLYHNFHCVANV